VFASLPNAVVTNNPGSTGTSTTIDLGAGGVYTYLFAKYDGQNDNSLVWNVSGLSGIITIPADGPLGHGLSGWILFGPAGTPGVPDGGTTVMLLGTALGALGMLRRALKI
jgi:VPDSG-CTERM motif